MSLCSQHKGLIKFLCVSKDCKADSTAICDHCINTTHNHGTNMNVNIDQINFLFEKVIALSQQNKHVKMKKMKLKNKIDEYIEDLKSDFLKLMDEVKFEYTKLCTNFQFYSQAQNKIDMDSVINRLYQKNYQSITPKEFYTFFHRLEQISLDQFGKMEIQLYTKFLQEFRGQIFEFEQRLQFLRSSSLFYKINCKHDFTCLKDNSMKIFLSEQIASVPKQVEIHISIEDKESKAHFRKGNDYDKVGKYFEALEEYNHAIEKNPKNVAAYNNKGITLKTIGKYDQAVKCFNIAINLNPTWSTAYINKANCFRLIGYYQASLKLYDRALNIDRKNISALYNKALSLNAMDRNQEALQTLKFAKEINHKDDDVIHLQGICMAALRKYEEAIKRYDFAIELNPHNDRAFFNKGVALMKVFEYEKALKCLEIACNFNPLDNDYKQKRIQLLHELGRDSEARQLRK